MNSQTIASATPDQKLLIAAALVNGYPTPIRDLRQQEESAAV
ncbi:hypothetical protein [Rhodococcus sp. NJ-530]|nr:hypothetical protein [Rhodococcus sp. NJ-530]